MQDSADLSLKLNTMLAAMRAVLRDEKPCFDPADSISNLLYKQVARMSSGLFVTDAPEAFFTMPGDTEAMVEEKGYYPIQSLGQTTLQKGRQIKQQLKAQNIANVKILGIDNSFRRLNIDQAEQENFAEALVLPSSDLYGLYQFLEIMRHRVENPQDEYGPLVLTNVVFWEPVVTALDLDKVDLSTINIHVSKQAVLAETLMASMKTPQVKAQKPFENFNVPDGATILVATRNTKKIAELQQIFDAMKVNVRLLPFHVVVGRPLEAKEESKSYIGNNWEKLEAARAKYEKIDPEKLERNFARQGIKAETTFVLFEDGGFETEYPFFKEPEFSEAVPHLNPHKNGPGVETANLLKVMNTREIFSRIQKIVDRKSDQGEAASMTVTDFSSMLLVPINDLSKAEDVSVSTFGVIRDRMTTTPSAFNKVIYTDHHFKPMEDAEERTRADIPDFITHKSMRALAVQALMYMTGLKEGNAPSAQFDKSAKGAAPDARRIGTQASLHPEVHGHGIRGWKHSLKDEFNVVTGQNGRFELTRQHSITINENSTRKTAYSGFQAFQEFVTEADAFVLGPMPDKMRSDDYKMKNLFMFTSLVVGKQVFDPHIQPKPIVINKDEWKDEIDVYDYSHDLTLIGDKPEHIFAALPEEDFKKASVKILKREMKDYVRLPAEDELFVENKGERSNGLFRVSIYSSASTKNSSLLNAAENLSYMLAAGGYAVKNGGGTEGMMAKTSEGVHRYRSEVPATDKGRVINWVGSIQCVDTVESEGLYTANEFVSIQPNIHLRMEDLQDVDAEIFMAGGAGTIQEMAATMINRMHSGKIENRPMILINQEIECGNKKMGVWDQMLKYIPDHLHEKCNLRVVNTIEEAVKIVNEARAARGMSIAYEKVISAANQNTHSLPVPTRAMV